MEYLLRLAKHDEKERIFQMKCEAYRDYVEKIWGWDQEWQIDNFNREFDNCINKVIVEDNLIIGFLQLRENDKHIYLVNIVIKREYQSSGIGSDIINNLTTVAKASDRSVKLQVFKINHSAIRLYTRLGFQLMSESPTHFEFEV
jgi:ribosomal protein S18 acetylase RimI-like enzyme